MQRKDFRGAMRTVDDAAGLFESRQNMAALVRLKGFDRGRFSANRRGRNVGIRTRRLLRLGDRSAFGGCSGEDLRFDLERRAVRQNDRSLQHVLKFANVPWPTILFESLHRRLPDRLDAHADASREASYEELQQQRHVSLT